MPPFTLQLDSNGVPYVGNLDTNDKVAVPTEQYIKVGNFYLPVSNANPLPSAQTNAPLSAVTTLQNAAAATGSGTQLPTNGYGIAVIAVSGTFVGTITWQGIGPDGVAYAISARLKGSASAPSSTTSSAGLYEVDCRGLSAVQANITAYTSGSITAKGWAQAISAPTDSVSATLFGSNVTVAGTSYATALNCPASAYQTITITPASGQMWKKIQLYLDILAPAGATTGYHTVEIRQGVNSVNYDAALFLSTYSNEIKVIANSLTTTGQTVIPSDATAMAVSLKGVRVTNTFPLYISYYNGTDVTQSQTMSIDIVREVETIV